MSRKRGDGSLYGGSVSRDHPALGAEENTAEFPSFKSGCLSLALAADLSSEEKDVLSINT